MTDFERTMKFLREYGFTLFKIRTKTYRITGKNIYGFIGDYGIQYGGYADGHIVADHKDCYDKPQKCPLIMILPRNEKEVEELKAHLKYLGSKTGFEWSNSYGFYDDPKLPRHIDK